MVNLIPPSAKRGVAIEYWARVVTVWAIIATVTAVLFSSMFLPVHVLVDGQIDAYKDSADEATEKIASFESASQELARATQQAQLIIASENELSMFEYIKLFDQIETNGIEYNRVFISRAGTGLSPAVLNGIARDRQSLSDFRDRLKEQAVVKDVDFPIENLAKDKDIDFSITVTMNNSNTP